MRASNHGLNTSRVHVDTGDGSGTSKEAQCPYYDDSFVGSPRRIALTSTHSLSTENRERLPDELKVRLQKRDCQGVMEFLLAALGQENSNQVPEYALGLFEASAVALPFDCQIRHILAQECLLAVTVEGIDPVSYAWKAVVHARQAANLDHCNRYHSRTLLVDCLFEVLSLGLAGMHTGPWQDAKMPYSQEGLKRHIKTYGELLRNYMLDLPNHPDAALDILQNLLNIATFDAARQVVFDEVISRIELFRESHEQSVVLT